MSGHVIIASSWRRGVYFCASECKRVFEMGASLSSNSASLSTDVYSSALETTNVTNSNANLSSNIASFDGCTVYSGGDVTINQSMAQAQQIEQYTAVQNTQVSTTNMNQQLLQEATSSVSGWGIGFSEDSNNTNIVASVSTQMTNAVNVSNTNVNQGSNQFSCEDSTFISAGDFTLNQTSDQSLVASQVSDTSQMQDITTSVSQYASQSATASVAGFSIGSLIALVVALIVLVVVIRFAFKSFTGSSSSGVSGGIDSVVQRRYTFYLLFWVTVLGVVCLIVGVSAYKQRETWACNSDSQCSPSGVSFLFTDTATCSCTTHLTCGLDPKPLVIANVAPPLFICNPIQSLSAFGANSGQEATLYPGSLQWMIISKVVSSQTTTTSSVRNNSGYNMLVYNKLLRNAFALDDDASGTEQAALIDALMVYAQRQFVLRNPVTSRNLLNTPNMSTSLSQWCKARIGQNLIPIQPIFAAPDGDAGLTGDVCINANSGEAPPSTSLLQRRKRKVKNIKFTRSFDFAVGEAIRKQRLLNKKKKKKKKKATTRLLTHAPLGAGKYPGAAEKKNDFLSRPSNKRLTAVNAWVTSDSRDSDCADPVDNLTPSFSSGDSARPAAPTGMNLFADVCYKEISTGNYRFKLPDMCPDGCSLTTSRVTNVDVIDGGSGYSGDFSVQMFSDGGSTAQATAHVADGSVVSVEVTNPGSGFTSVPTASFDGNAVLVPVVRSFCVTNDDKSKLCTGRCDTASGWEQITRTQPTVLSSACTEGGTGTTSTGTVPQMYMKNLLRTPGVDGTDNSTTRCYVPAGSGDAGYSNDKNQNKLFDQECATTPASFNTNTDCTMGQLDSQIKDDVPTMMALQFNYMQNNSSKSVKASTVGIGLNARDKANSFFTNFTGVVGAEGTSSNTWIKASGSGGNDVAYFEGQANGLANPYCNAAVGLCQATDASRVDYDPDCPPERTATEITGSGTATNYESTCGQQPITGCAMFDVKGQSLDAAARTCSMDNVGACYSRPLCVAMGGSWTWDSDNSGYKCSADLQCPTDTLYNASNGSSCDASGACMDCGSKSSCESTLFVNDGCEDVCAALSSQAECTGSSEKTCGQSDVQSTTGDYKCKCQYDEATSTCSSAVSTGNLGCGWNDATGTCVMSCSPSINVCDNCGSADKCSAPCNWDAIVTSVTVDSPGSGYTDAVVAELQTTYEGGATFQVNVAPGRVTGVEVVDAGSGYASAPTVTFSDPVTDDAHDTEELVAATATATVEDGIITAITITDGGSGYYTGTPTISVEGAGEGFSATVIVVNGSVQRVDIFDGGVDYGPVVTVSGGGGSGATAQAVVADDGTIASVTLTSGGTGYTSEPTVSIDGNAVLSATVLLGSIGSVDVLNSGTGYDTSESDTLQLTFYEQGHDGADATATVTLTGSCFLGINICALTSTNSTTSSAEAALLEDLYVVRLPSAFLATAASSATSTSTLSGCMPNVFVPDVSNSNSTVFVNNCSTNVQAEIVGTGTFSSCCTTGELVPTGESDSTATYDTTCLMKNSTDGLDMSQYYCGCPDGTGGTASSCLTTFDDNDYLCEVGYSASKKSGGFVLRSVSSFNSTNCAYALYNTGCSTTGQEDPYEELANYAAGISENLVTWQQVNVNDDQSTRFNMFLRIYYWLLLSQYFDASTLSKLGMATFLNDLGYSGTKPAAYMSDDAISNGTYYATQPLLVYDEDGNPHFYTLQELKEGTVADGYATVTTARTPLANADYYLQQLGMWCFNPSVMGISSDISSTGLGEVSTTQDSASDALSTATDFYGLHYGSFGYCETWFTGDTFVGSMLGAGSLLLAAVVAYIIYAIVQATKK